jgi:hypothetical protein
MKRDTLATRCRTVPAETQWDLLLLWQCRMSAEWRRETPPASDPVTPIEIAGMVEHLDQSAMPCAERVKCLTGFLSIVRGTWHGQRFLASAESFVFSHLRDG